METTVRKRPHRYELYLDEQMAGFADYHEAGGAIVLPHTVINPELRGQGLGAVLVKAALDDLRATGHRVVPRCWYVAEYIDLHPEYRDLLAA